MSRSSSNDPQGHCAAAPVVILRTSGTLTPSVGMSDFMYDWLPTARNGSAAALSPARTPAISSSLAMVATLLACLHVLTNRSRGVLDLDHAR
ncbi:hypothetical protein D9M72_538560 [compost metagenome]